ncbi:sensor histidine kinase [Streptomyces sp. NPDC051561]|uniref:sensor histidine kinase n=1 Tax=Streptomyces sp. NPDC051561 TaxID=3365658 RepID=UPI0037A8BE72
MGPGPLTGPTGTPTAPKDLTAPKGLAQGRTWGRTWRQACDRTWSRSRDSARHGIAQLRRPAVALPRPSRRSRIFDVLLAVGLGVHTLHWAANQGAALVHESHEGIGPIGRLTETGSTIAAILLTVLAYGPLTVRRRYPLAVLWAVTLATALAPEDATRLTFYAVVIAAYTAAVYSPYRLLALAGLPVTVLTVGTDERTRVWGVDTAPPTVPTQYVPLLILIPLIFAAHGLRAWKLRSAESEDRMSALEHEQAEQLRRAAAQERSRIARELHDVVTHNVSMMTIQAGAARKVMDFAPDQAREALLAVEAAGRAAMAELRHTMGLLTMNADGTEDAAEGAVLAPQPGLDQLECLVTGVRNTGLPVTLTTTGTPREVPSGIGLAAYRVVQEALTNTVKHADGAAADITVDYTDDHLTVEITDTGGAPSASAATGHGRGLTGLRERLTIYGGTLHTGPRPTGGHQVRARIPLMPQELS